MSCTDEVFGNRKVGLVVGELFRSRWRPHLTQIPDRRQHQPTPPNFTSSETTTSQVRNEIPT
jgi:hypothetical protein